MLPAVLATTGSNAIVDHMVVELRDAVTPATVIATQGALLQRDGDVVAMDGVSPVILYTAPGNYHVAIRHRNHLGTMTAVAVTLSGTTTVVDFTLPGTGTYGTNAQVQIGTRTALWAGEVTGDGVVKYTGTTNDRDAVLQAIGGLVPTNTLNNVYDRRDVNLDGTVKYTGTNSDRDVILNTIGGVVPTNTRTQQLP